MGTDECSQPAFKSSWDSQDFDDVSMVLQMVHFRKSTRPQWVKKFNTFDHLCKISAADTRHSRSMVATFKKIWKYGSAIHLL